MHKKKIKDKNVVLSSKLSWTFASRVEDIQAEFLRLINTQPRLLDEYRLMERFASGPITSFVQVFVDKNPALVFPLQIVWVSKNNFPNLNQNFYQKITSILIDLSCLNFLFVGNLLHIDKNYVVYDEDKIDLSTAYQSIFEIINLTQKENCHSGSMIHLDENQHSLLHASFHEEGFLQPVPDFEMRLEIRDNWKDWNSYLKDLTKKYAVRARKIRESMGDLSFRFLSYDEILKHETEIQLLYLQTVHKQDVALAKASNGYFASLKLLFGENFRLKGCFKQDKLIAFYTWFDAADTIEMHFIGLDYKLNLDHNLYFNILYEGLLDGIDFSKTKINYGRTCLDAKASLGAKAYVSPSYIKLYKINKLVSSAFQNYLTKLETSQWKSRNPLKDEVLTTSLAV